MFFVRLPTRSDGQCAHTHILLRTPALLTACCTWKRKQTRTIVQTLSFCNVYIFKTQNILIWHRVHLVVLTALKDESHDSLCFPYCPKSHSKENKNCSKTIKKHINEPRCCPGRLVPSLWGTRRLVNPIVVVFSRWQSSGPWFTLLF